MTVLVGTLPWADPRNLGLSAWASGLTHGRSLLPAVGVMPHPGPTTCAPGVRDVHTLTARHPTLARGGEGG